MVFNSCRQIEAQGQLTADGRKWTQIFKQNRKATS
jgi:hypothetical protein